MVNHRYKRAVLGITTALVVSACTVPAMAAPITVNTDQSISVVSTDNTYAGGLDLEARIITTVEQDQRSPYAKKGIAVADDYLKIHTEPNGDAEVVGKLYSGSGCEIEEVKDGWAHITSGDCDGYVEAKYLLTGTDAEAYAEEHKVSELVAKSQSEQMYMYEEPSADAKIVTTVLWDQELTVLGASDDGQWVQVKVGDNTGYIPADSVVLDVKYEEAVSVDEEQTKKESETAETKAAETETSETEAETEKETTAETETKAAETETAETKATETEKAQQDKASSASYTDVNETVWATYSVSIRSAASTDADKLDVLVGSYSITRTGVGDNGWSKVDYKGQTGYIKSEYLTTTKPAAASDSTQQTSETKQETKETKETVYATAGVNIRAKASADADKIGTLAAGGSITRTGKTSSGWSRVDYNGQTGYIKSDYLTTTKPTVTSNTTASSTSSSSSLGQQIADFAVQYVGYPYVYGGNSLTNGVDCSGFTQQVYLHFGYSIPRRASIQATVGTSVAISDLQPGDLVFYGDSEGVGHVVIYIGNGKVVHASTPSKGIIISDLYYRTPMCAKRII